MPNCHLKMPALLCCVALLVSCGCVEKVRLGAGRIPSPCVDHVESRHT